MMLRRRLVSSVALLSVALFSSTPALASVVMAGTRFVFPSKEREITVRMTSQNAEPVLMQVWIDAGDPKSTPDSVAPPFLVTPPLVRINAKQDQSIRILALPNQLPTDRESVFYLNTLEIPPKPTGPQFAGKNTLQFALHSRMKLFWRPAGLPGNADTAGQQLTWKAVPEGKGYALEIRNPTPYYVTVVKASLPVDGETLHNERSVMVAPRGQARLDLAGFTHPLGAQAALQYETVNDYGTLVPFKGTVTP